MYSKLAQVGRDGRKIYLFPHNMLEPVPIIEQEKNYTAYDCDTVYYIQLKKWAVMSEHQHPYPEIWFLMKWEVEAIIGDTTTRIQAPAKLTIPANIYHKFTMLTDGIVLEIK